jgi:hypothetical protein
VANDETDESRILRGRSDEEALSTESASAGQPVLPGSALLSHGSWGFGVTSMPETSSARSGLDRDAVKPGTPSAIQKWSCVRDVGGRMACQGRLKQSPG